LAERDPEIHHNRREPADWARIRRENARAGLRRQVAIIAENRTDRAAAPLPLHKSVYTGVARNAAEMERLFRSEPLVAGLSGDIPNPGDVMLFDAAGPSIIVSRGKDGAVRAFLNMCTHRGARLIEEREPWRGHLPRIVCPFHAWTFDTGGKLTGQPGKEGFAGCDIGARNLIELPCAEHIGLIFVRADPGGAPIDATEHLGSFGPVLEQLELWRAEPVEKGIMTANSNWKFALDTYGEGYHFKQLHNTTIGQTHYSDRNVYDAFGRHHRVSFPDLSVGALVGKEEATWPETDYGGVHYLFPNTVIFFGAVTPGVYFTQVFRLFPDGPGKTVCQFAVYAPYGVESEEHRAACKLAYDATAQVVQTEDYRVASHGYANLMTAPADFCVVLGANEPALHGVHRHIAAAIGMLLDRIEGDTGTTPSPAGARS
jgi:phenylpropionate dioxygenase-like ring-hydroxylating dioxygenase large terminal subunit